VKPGGVAGKAEDTNSAKESVKLRVDRIARRAFPVSAAKPWH